MADFPFSVLEIDPNMEMGSTQFPEWMNFHSFTGFSGDHFLAEFPGSLPENFPGIFHHEEKNVALPPAVGGNGNDYRENKKRKAMEIIGSESCSMNSSPSVSESGNKRKNGFGRRKRVKTGDAKEEEEEEKSREVVHVRARRGQATDSHSLAERVRRGKINERLKCLQDIVPGCYKAMGMAVMLDEIINYVQSLQNQVEFLSMKLAAASIFHDFSSEADTLDIMQRAKAVEAQKVQMVMRGGVEELASTQTQQHHSLDLPFGCCYPPYKT